MSRAMNGKSVSQAKSTTVPPRFSLSMPGILQRKCDCGGVAGLTGQCEECNSKRLSGQGRVSNPSVGDEVSQMAAVTGTEQLPGHSFGRMSVQAKLAIGQPGDKYEQEADRVASQVVQQINPPAIAQSTQGQSAQRQEEKEEALQVKPSISDLQRSPLPQELDSIQTKAIIKPTRDFEGDDPGEAFSLLDANGKGKRRASGPPPGSQPQDQPRKKLAPATPAPLQVNFPPIRTVSTPAGMPDRIPPTVNTPIQVTLSRATSPRTPVTLSVQGSGGGNGTATINGNPTYDLSNTQTVQITGGNQTTPGNAGNLRLLAHWHGNNVGTSNPFSVAAIPQNFSITFHSLITGNRRGIKVNNAWQSDSGNVADLDQVQRSEQVQYGVGTGVFHGVVGNNSGYLPANNPPIIDSHGAGIGILTGVGNINADQVFIFQDARTGVANIPVTNSGFQITRNVAANVGGGFQITTRKRGLGVTANGYTSTAAQGDESRTQAV